MARGLILLLAAFAAVCALISAVAAEPALSRKVRAYFALARLHPLGALARRLPRRWHPLGPSRVVCRFTSLTKTFLGFSSWTRQTPVPAAAAAVPTLRKASTGRAAAAAAKAAAAKAAATVATRRRRDTASVTTAFTAVMITSAPATDRARVLPPAPRRAVIGRRAPPTRHGEVNIDLMTHSLPSFAATTTGATITASVSPAAWTTTSGTLSVETIKSVVRRNS